VVVRAWGKQERGKGAAVECPHHDVELLEYLLIGGEQRSGGAASSRSAAAESGCARVSWAEAAAAG
jgi:hypothetical protein